VLVYGDIIQSSGDFTVEVTSAAVLLASVTPDRSGRNAPITLTIAGAGFDGTSSVQLVDAGGTAHPAATAEVDSFTQITAAFGAGTLAPGAYSVRVTSAAGGSAILTNAFQVLVGGLANFATDLVVPSWIGIHAPATVQSQYRNTGDAPMPAPLLVLTAAGCGREGAFLTTQPWMLADGLWTSAEPAGFSHAVQFLGSGQTPGVLQPGESFTVPTYYAGWQQPWGCGTVNWNLGVLKAEDPTPVDWTSLKDSMRPASIDAEAWDALWASFTAQVGTTWGDYVRMLDDNAAYLGRLGLRVVDVGQLLAFEFMQADGLTPLRTLAGAVDASVEAPGLPLVFRRSFAEPISHRFVLGPLGRGWSHNWQYSLTKAIDGTVTVFGPGGSQRVFQPDSRNAGYFTQAGDHATLTPLGGGAFTVQENSGVAYAFRTDGKLDYVEDPNRNRIMLGYSGNLLVSLSHSAGQSLQISYNGVGRIRAVTDHLGRQTLLSYDGANEDLTGVRYADGRTAGYVYASAPTAGRHALVEVASSCCNRRYFDYDSQGRLTGTHLEGNAEAITFSYDTAGRVTVTDALGHASKFYFDHRGLLAKTEDALGNAVHLAFDNDYNLVSIMDQTGRSYGYEYDARGNLTTSRDPLGHVSRFTFHSAFSRLASVTDARGNATRYSYDSSGNLQSTTYADGTHEDWSYDPEGNAETWQNRRGHETFYTYDNDGRVTAKYFADGAMTDYAYDTRGNLTNTATYDPQLFPLESVSMAYDASNRLARIDHPGGKFLAFTYDIEGRRASSVDQLGHRLSYTYDLAGRLQSLTNELNALVVLYHYDPAGRLARKTLGSGIFTDYAYDPAGQLLNLTNYLAGGAVLSRFNYTYDSRGRRTSMDTLDGHWNYDYDDLGQLTHAVFASTAPDIPDQNLAYVYDEVGNRKCTVENGVTNQYTANNLNQYTQVGATNFTFDADGNLIRQVPPQGTTTHTYSDENRLVATTSPEGTWQYNYDGLGNRMAKTENGTVTRFVVDPIGLGNVVGEYDGVGNLLAHYDHALGVLTRTDAGGSTAGYTFDAIGNVQKLVTATGAVVNQYAYTPFGTSLRRTEGLPNPFQYVGQFGVMKEVNGRSYMRARFLDTGLGRFLSCDPIGLPMGFPNLYRYAFNSPLNAMDPSGLLTESEELGGIRTTIKELTIEANRREVWWGPFENLGGVFGLKKDPWVCYVWQAKVKARLAELDLQHWKVIEDGWWIPIPMTDIYLGVHHFITIESDRGQRLRIDPWLFGSNLPAIPWSHYSAAVSYSGDPNQVIGPAGFGVNGFVPSLSTFAYRIDFENMTNATAPAQQVLITDTLGPYFDWSTVALTELGFGDLLIVLPPKTQHFETNVPVSYLGTNYQVQIELGINPASGLLTAAFRSIDPATSLPPPVNIGFLPPEDGTGRGQGHVTFTINARSGLSTGTQLRNVALISFDNQTAISTDQVDPLDPAKGVDPAKQALITLDSAAPTSHVLPLPAQSHALQIPVSWTGQDDTGGAGIASYDIYVSDNGGEWTLWRSATTNTTDSYRGLPLHTYGFYSAAHDNAGNVEPPHAGADATTTVVAMPLLEVTMAPAVTTLNEGDTFIYTLTVKNNGTLNLSNVVLSNFIPAGLYVEWVQYGRGTCEVGDEAIVWSLGNLNTNRTAVMSVTATVLGMQTMTNMVTVRDDAGAASASATQTIHVGNTAPALSIHLADDEVIVAWPETAAGFVLEVTTDPSTPVGWQAVPNTPTTVGQERRLALPVMERSHFYRLRKP
jgi:RHS repeat-associated protein/uncharacterized repeat protein (TIGR01451 family)